MQRYFIPSEQFLETTVTLHGGDAHHIIRVMRAQVGDQIICSNGLNREALVAITSMDKETVEAAVVEERAMTNETAVEVWIAQSLPKGDKLETIIQKCTEIGAARIIPFVSERTIVQYDDKKEAKRLERWAKIAKEAAEQAHRNKVPDVSGPQSWKQILQLISQVEIALICYEKESGLQLKQLLVRTFANNGSGPALGKVMLLIGPEGGFTPKEVSEAESAGSHSISLGKRILRTETAAMVALTCVLYESGEMGG
ncbi:MAG: methyltransferase, RsmE family [Bacilli bacterium]|nr:methyltransferase, RsmE family [Bacilli bacterium]